MKKVSIIVPVYNAERYIDKCLDSLVNQTLDNIEVILVNDGSTDNSLQIMKTYEENYPLIVKVLSQINGGQGKARNYGIKYASGQYLGFVDSDDYIEYTMFEKLYVEAISKNSDLVICPYYRVDENGQILFTEMKDVQNNFLNINTSPWNKLYKREIWNKYEIKFAENLWYEDLQAVLPFVFISNKINWLNEPLYYYVQRKDSSINLYSERINDIFEVFNNIHEFTQTNILKMETASIEYYYIMHLVFGHLSRCATEENFYKRRELIMNTKDYLINLIPTYNQNRYFKFKYIKKKPISLFLIKYIGYKMFNINLYDYFLIIYRLKLRFNSNTKRW